MFCKSEQNNIHNYGNDTTEVDVEETEYWQNEPNDFDYKLNKNGDIEKKRLKSVT